MGELVMTDLFTITAALARCEPGGYSALPGRATLLGRSLFCRLLFFFMGIIKMHFFVYLSCWLRLLLIECGDVESNPCPGSDKGSSIPIFVVFMPIWRSWLWLDRIMRF